MEQNNLPNFVPVFLGLDEHLDKGKFTPTAHSVYCLLLRHCNWETGVFHGCSEKLALLYGGRTTAKEVKGALLFLKNNQLINYRRGTGKRGNYDILIHKHIARKGALTGYRLNAFADNSLQTLLYEWPTGGRPEVSLRTSGQRPDDGLKSASVQPEASPIQEYRELQEVKKSKKQEIQKVQELSSKSISSCSSCSSFGLELVPVGVGFQGELTTSTVLEEQDEESDMRVKPTDWGTYTAQQKNDWYNEGTYGVEVPVQATPTRQGKLGKASSAPSPVINSTEVPAGWSEQEKNTPTFYLWSILEKPQGSVPPKSWIPRMNALESDSELSPEEFKKFLHWAVVDNFDASNPNYKGSASWLPSHRDPVGKLAEHLSRLLPGFRLYVRTEQVLANKTLPPTRYVDKPHYMNPKYSVVAEMKKNRKS